MKISKFLTIALLLGVVAFSSCKPPPPTEPDIFKIQTTMLAHTWVVKTDARSVTLGFVDGVDVTEVWSEFKITFTEAKGYSTSGVPAGFEGVWPASGTWDFKADDINTIIRDGDDEIGIVVSDAELTMNFTFEAGRTSATDGDWKFSMKK